MKDERRTAVNPEGVQPQNGSPSAKTDASWEKHVRIKRKLFAVHGELLRKLAEHDRQR